MLFGTKAIREMIERDVRIIEEKYNISVIFGAAVSSLERGITKYSTDYDIRFLFYYNDKKDLPTDELHEESIIRIREFFKEQTRPYDCIALWEVSAFLNMLIEPFISKGNNYHLIQIVYDTLYSPYVYDPLGLTAKISPYLDSSFNIENEKVYLYHKLIDFVEQDRYYLIETLNGFYNYMKLKWIIQKGKMAPVYYYTLLQNENKKNQHDFMILYQQIDTWNKLQYKGLYLQKDIEIEAPQAIVNTIKEYISQATVADEYCFGFSERQKCACKKVIDIVKNAIEDKDKRYCFMENSYEKSCY